MRSHWLRVDPNPMTDILIKREEFVYNKGGRDWTMFLQARKAKDFWLPGEAKKERTDSSLEPSEEA